MKGLLLVAALFFISHVQCGYKYVCHICAKDNQMAGFDDEDEFVKHSDWHGQQNEEAKAQLIADAQRQQDEEDNRPKLFHCHHCQYLQSFNSSTEFIAHIEKEHRPTTVEECTLFVPQGKLKMKGYKEVPPEMAGLNAEFNPRAPVHGGMGGMGGMGGGGPFGGMGGGMGGGGDYNDE